jgi:hypothetical protein
MEVRELKTKDIFTVAKMLLKISGEAREEISTLISSKQEETEGEKDKAELKKQQTDLGLQIFMSLATKLMEHAEDDLISWFGDLTGMTKEEFANSELTASLDVIEELSERDDFKTFLSRAYALYKKMTVSEKTPKKN